MTYQPRVPEYWRRTHRVAMAESARRQRALARLNQRRWRSFLQFLNLLFWLCAQVMFWLLVGLLVCAAICGLVLGGLNTDRRQGR